MTREVLLKKKNLRLSFDRNVIYTAAKNCSIVNKLFTAIKQDMLIHNLHDTGFICKCSVSKKR
jgi:hypothetical protein